MGGQTREREGSFIRGPVAFEKKVREQLVRSLMHTETGEEGTQQKN